MTDHTKHTDAVETTTDSQQPVLTAGAVGGLVGTVAMTVLRVPTARSLPPTADFLSRWLGGEPDDYPLAALALHLAYGAGAGAVFGLASLRPRAPFEEPETVGLLAGVVYGAVLSVAGERVVVRHLVGLDLDTDESAVFHAGHVVYGLTLGAWVGSRAPRAGPEEGGPD